jgi:hypothetical protein
VKCIILKLFKDSDLINLKYEFDFKFEWPDFFLKVTTEFDKDEIKKMILYVIYNYIQVI